MGAMPAAITPAVPMHVQLRDLYAGQIERGALPPGERLPTVRAMAARHAVSATTAARAVKLLAAGGLVVTEGRHGTFVSPRPG